MYELPPATRFSSNRICQWGLQSAARLKWEAPLPGASAGSACREEGGRRRHTRGGSEGVAPPRGECGEKLRYPVPEMLPKGFQPTDSPARRAPVVRVTSQEQRSLCRQKHCRFLQS